MRASSRAIARLTPEGVTQGPRRPWRRCLLHDSSEHATFERVSVEGHGEIRDWDVTNDMPQGPLYS